MRRRAPSSTRVRSAHIEQAFGVWNARGTGRWTRGDGFVIADLSFTPEQVDEAAVVGPTAIVVALFEVELWIGE